MFEFNETDNIGKYITIGKNKEYKVYLDKIIKKSYTAKFKAIKYQVGETMLVELTYIPLISSPVYKEKLEVLKKFHHENIVQLNDIIIKKREFYLIFEYCDRGSLKDYLKKVKLIKEDEAIEIMKQLVKGVEYYISRNLIHHDLKPSNILRKNSNKQKFKNICKIDNFNSANIVEDINKNYWNYRIGTPLYMAPEIFLKKKYGYKCDIWSLGIIFYEILHGKIPWNGTNISDLFENNILKKPLEFDQTIRENVRNLIQNMLEINPDKRINLNELILTLDNL